MLLGLPPDHRSAEPLGKEALKMFLTAVSSEWGSAIIVGRGMKIIDERVLRKFSRALDGIGYEGFNYI